MTAIPDHFEQISIRNKKAAFVHYYDLIYRARILNRASKTVNYKKELPLKLPSL
jgi:hypothetical protein